MTAKEYLLQAVRIRRQIYHIKLRCEELTAKLGYHPLRLDNTGASRATPEDKVTYTLAELGDYEREYENQIGELKKKLDEITNFVDKMPNVRHAELIKWRYLTENRNNQTKLYTWVSVAFRMNLPNENAAWAMHKRAIREFEKIFNESKGE